MLAKVEAHSHLHSGCEACFFFEVSLYSILVKQTISNVVQCFPSHYFEVSRCWKVSPIVLLGCVGQNSILNVLNPVVQC